MPDVPNDVKLYAAAMLAAQSGDDAVDAMSGLSAADLEAIAAGQEPTGKGVTADKPSPKS